MKNSFNAANMFSVNITFSYIDVFLIYRLFMVIKLVLITCKPRLLIPDFSPADFYDCINYY